MRSGGPPGRSVPHRPGETATHGAPAICTPSGFAPLTGVSVDEQRNAWSVNAPVATRTRLCSAGVAGTGAPPGAVPQKRPYATQSTYRVKSP